MPTVLRTALWIGLCRRAGGAALLAFPLHTRSQRADARAVSRPCWSSPPARCYCRRRRRPTDSCTAYAPGRASDRRRGSLPLVLVVLVVLGALCGGAGWFEAWWMSAPAKSTRQRSSPATSPAPGGCTRRVHWLVVLVQWVLVPAWCATALAWIAGYERRDVLTLKWLTAGLEWRVLLVTLLGVSSWCGCRGGMCTGGRGSAGIGGRDGLRRHETAAHLSAHAVGVGLSPCGRPLAACRRHRVPCDHVDRATDGAGCRAPRAPPAGAWTLDRRGPGDSRTRGTWQVSTLARTATRLHARGVPSRRYRAVDGRTCFSIKARSSNGGIDVGLAGAPTQARLDVYVSYELEVNVDTSLTPAIDDLNTDGAIGVRCDVTGRSPD